MLRPIDSWPREQTRTRRQALKHLHPDATGQLEDTDGFLRLQRAIKTLDENDAS